MTFSGANRDEVVAPDTGFPIKQAEQFDPETARWTPIATAHKGRTYHNTAVLLPSGQVLVGGHSPISTLDSYNTTIPGGFSDGFRNPSFEIYNPPYMSWGPQPTISSVSGNLTTPDAQDIASVVLVRNTALDPPRRRRSGHRGTADLIPVRGQPAGRRPRVRGGPAPGPLHAVREQADRQRPATERCPTAHAEIVPTRARSLVMGAVRSRARLWDARGW